MRNIISGYERNDLSEATCPHFELERGRRPRARRHRRERRAEGAAQPKRDCRSLRVGVGHTLFARTVTKRRSPQQLLAVVRPRQRPLSIRLPTHVPYEWSTVSFSDALGVQRDRRRWRSAARQRVDNGAHRAVSATLTAALNCREPESAPPRVRRDTAGAPSCEQVAGYRRVFRASKPPPSDSTSSLRNARMDVTRTPC
jgi:hypothetical protein